MKKIQFKSVFYLYITLDCNPGRQAIPHHPRRYWLEVVTGLVTLLAAKETETFRPKASRVASGYRPHPFGKGASCGNCANYRDITQSCARVRGAVASNGFCNFYTPRRPRL
ncbi:MAG TPA: hypothetical protein PLV07_04345 [Acidiphilium sp.]|nr:hypothetical protein [Acidiphilium sp.]